MLIQDIFLNRYTEQPMQIALQTADKSWTYQELYDGAEQIRHYVAGRVSAKTHIGIIVNNNPHFVMSLFGVLMSDCVVVLIPYFSKITEIIAYMTECDISLLITDKLIDLKFDSDTLKICEQLFVVGTELAVMSVVSGKLDTLGASSLSDVSSAAVGMSDVLGVYDEQYLSKSTHSLDALHTSGDTSPVSDNALNFNTATALDEQLTKSKESLSSYSLALLIPTSGSTGKPKVIMLSHDNIVSSCIAHSQRVGLNEQDCFFISMPLCFSSSITTQLLSCFYTKTQILLLELPIVTRKLSFYFKQFRITSLAGAPTLLNMLYKEYERTGIDFPGVHTYISSAAPLIKTTLTQGKKIFPKADFLQTYGQSEASPRISIMDRSDLILSCGKAVEGVTVKIVDDARNMVERGVIGQIWIKGSNVMLGYYKNKALTEQVIIEGWLNTRDIGYQDESGNIYIVGRSDNIINVGGLKVYPEEVETLLKEHTHIEECLVFSVTEAYKGEMIIAYIQFKPGKNLNKQQLFQYCLEKLSNYKIPTKWYEVKNFIKTHTAKLNRNAITELETQRID